MSADYNAGPEDICTFGKGCEPGVYARRDASGTFQPACFDCARKPYPVPKQFQKAVNPEAGAAAERVPPSWIQRVDE